APWSREGLWAAVIALVGRDGCRRRRRWRTDDGNAPPRSLELDERVHVVMAVNDKLRAMPRQCGAKFAAVDEPFQMPRRRADRRMMDQHHAKEPLAAAALKRRGELSHLPVPPPPAPPQRRR